MANHKPLQIFFIILRLPDLHLYKSIATIRTKTSNTPITANTLKYILIEQLNIDMSIRIKYLTDIEKMSMYINKFDELYHFNNN